MKQDGFKKKGRYFNSKKNKKEKKARKWRSKEEGLEDYTFDCGGADHAAQFTNSLKEVCNYVERTYDGGYDLAESITQRELKEFEEPEDPDDPTNKVEVAKWSIKHTEYTKKVKQLNENAKKAYALIWHQCSPNLRSTLEGSDGYQAMSSA